MHTIPHFNFLIFFVLFILFLNLAQSAKASPAGAYWATDPQNLYNNPTISSQPYSMMH